MEVLDLFSNSLRLHSPVAVVADAVAVAVVAVAVSSAFSMSNALSVQH